MVICGGIVYISLHYTTATNATLIYNSSSLMIVLMDAFYFGKRLTWMRIFGLFVGFVGVAVIVLNGDLSRFASLQFNIGDIGILIASLAWAIYSVMLKRERLHDLPTLTLFAAIVAVGAICLVPFVIYEIAATGIVPFSPNAWISIVSLAIIPGVLAFGTFQMCVKRVGPTLTSVFFYLTPAFGVLFAVLLLGETFRLYHAVGLVLVVAGVAIASDPFNRSGDQA
jgi:drug/metabolite transporter (DMT)-like permease